MPQITIDQAMQVAVQHHQAGRLGQAEQIYQQILVQAPGYAPALHHLGLIAYQSGKNETAIELIQKAIGLAPDYAEAYSNLANALKDVGRLDESIAACQKAITLKSDFPEAYNNLGNALRDRGEWDEAIAACRKAIVMRPDYPEAHSNLGNALTDKGRYDEAVEAFHRAIELRPNYPEAHSNLANALVRQGKPDAAIGACRQAIALRPNYDQAHLNLGIALAAAGNFGEAIAAYQQAISLRPNFAEAHNNLGNVLRSQGELEAAAAAYRHAIAARPDYAEAHYNLGIALSRQGQLDQAIAAFRLAITLKPDFPQAYINVGNALKAKGQLDEALAAYRQAVTLRPEAAELHSNIVYAVGFHPDYGPQEILYEARSWARQHAEPLSVHIVSHNNDRSPDRLLRIGYVSPNFRDHVVGRNVLPVLENHDMRQFEIHCFAQVETPDALTHRFHQIADYWHDTIALSDAELADRVRRERIDILVDLNLHMSGSRLLTFARKPAPIQVTWAGYPGTTGLNAIDYRLTDPYLDPIDKEHGDIAQRDALYSEKSIRLPHSFWCYRSPSGAPEVNPLPALSTGYVTFGCLNNFCKVTAPALDLWIRVLQSVPRSRLLILSPAGSHRQEIQRQFQARGVEAERIDFVSHAPLAEYMAMYHRIDIALDPLPYTGHSTSLDAFWLGAPVVTLCGATAAARGGVSIASNLGMTELIAHTTNQYVDIAAGLAGDLAGLSELRSNLRRRMQNSPLMDEGSFTRHLEHAYREMWRNWLGRLGSEKNRSA